MVLNGKLERLNIPSSTVHNSIKKFEESGHQHCIRNKSAQEQVQKSLCENTVHCAIQK